MQKISHEFKTTVISLLVLGLAGVGIFYGYNWFVNKQVRVANGVARPTFPYSDYSNSELEAMYPQVANENVATTRTPEETHKMFVDKLKAGDLDGVVECCVTKIKAQEMRTLLAGVKSRGQMSLMLNDIQNVRKDFIGDTKATYIYAAILDGQKIANYIHFLKNRNGEWLINSL